MKLEILIATMNQKNFELLKTMNISNNAVIANQVKDKMLLSHYNNNNKMITTDTIGVGINRNIALSNSSADICLLADDDMYYYDGVFDKVIQEFENNPDADIIIFNIDEIKDGVKIKSNSRKNISNKRITLLNFQNYGAVRIAFKREKVIRKNIWFSILFGGGSQYSHGEDTLFLKEAIDKKLKIITSGITIGQTDISKSSWFDGYNDKFFYDKGALMKAMFPRTYMVFCIFYYPMRFSKISKVKFYHIASMMMKGAKNFL